MARISVACHHFSLFLPTCSLQENDLLCSSAWVANKEVAPPETKTWCLHVPPIFQQFFVACQCFKSVWKALKTPHVNVMA